MKKLIESIKASKTKKIALCFCTFVLIGAITVFAIGKISSNKLKNPDKAIDNLLAVFYTNDYNENIAKELLGGKTTKEYFGELKQNSYDAVYNSLKGLGEGTLIDGKDAVTIANDYTDASVNLMKKVKKYTVAEKQEIDGGYRFTIKVVPANLNDIYGQANECAANLTEKIKNEDPQLASLDGHEYAIYYYCITKGMNDGGKEEGAEQTISVIMKKNEKGKYIPDESSLLALISASY